MAKNVSLERFKKLTDELKKEVLDGAASELNAQAQQLAELIQSVTPTHEGKLKTSVHVVQGNRPTLVRIVAGNSDTVKDGYNYARADEFGTVKMRARPFFFPTYRLRKKKIISSMKRKITASIKKRSAV